MHFHLLTLKSGHLLVTIFFNYSSTKSDATTVQSALASKEHPPLCAGKLSNYIVKSQILPISKPA